MLRRVEASKRAEPFVNLLNPNDTTQLDIVGAGHRSAIRQSIRIPCEPVNCSWRESGLTHQEPTLITRHDPPPTGYTRTKRTARFPVNTRGSASSRDDRRRPEIDRILQGVAGSNPVRPVAQRATSSCHTTAVERPRGSLPVRVRALDRATRYIAADCVPSPDPRSPSRPAPRTSVVSRQPHRPGCVLRRAAQILRC